MTETKRVNVKTEKRLREQCLIHPFILQSCPQTSRSSTNLKANHHEVMHSGNDNSASAIKAAADTVSSRCMDIYGSARVWMHWTSLLREKPKEATIFIGKPKIHIDVFIENMFRCHVWCVCVTDHIQNLKRRQRYSFAKTCHTKFGVYVYMYTYPYSRICSLWTFKKYILIVCTNLCADVIRTTSFWFMLLLCTCHLWYIYIYISSLYCATVGNRDIA